MGEAVERIRSVDTLGIPLGPGQPGAFLHALGDRDDYEALDIFGALLVDLYGVFTKKGVKYVSGFFGPAERILRDLGSDVQFVPADFRRFGPLLAELKPRVMTTVATTPDADGYMSLSLYAGASVEALHEAGADPDRLLVVEADAAFPYTVGLPPEHTHRLHVDEVDVLVESDRPPFVLADADATDVEEAIAEWLEAEREGDRLDAAATPDRATEKNYTRTEAIHQQVRLTAEKVEKVVSPPRKPVIANNLSASGHCACR